MGQVGGGSSPRGQKKNGGQKSAPVCHHLDSWLLSCNLTAPPTAQPARYSKVKCDEAKPFCLKCSKTRRNCDGYAPKDTWKLTCPSDCGASHTSRYGFFHYGLCLAIARSYELSTFSGEERLQLSRSFRIRLCWNVTIPQTAWWHPSVKHSLIATASLHESLKDSLGLSVDAASFPIQQYNQAIRYLTQASVPMEVLLLSCLLFLCVRGVCSSPTHEVYSAA